MNPVSSLIYAIVQRISQVETKDYEATKTNRKIANATIALAVLNLFLVVTSVFSVAAFILQWRTLEKTDKTLRVGERAFVYTDGMDVAKSNDGAGDKWTFLLNAVNNGGTQTKYLYFYVICKYGGKIDIPPVSTSFLGPKQKTGMGACVWPEDDVERLWNNNWSVEITVGIFYIDAFNDSHFTRVCRQISVKSDPRNATTLQHEDSRCSESADCADKECFR